MITIGSLFSGIGGLELGLEAAGLGPVLWQVEKDEFCRSILAKHWPHVQRFDDVTTARSLPPVDLLCGGFPCQDVSTAGKQAGLAGDRSGLWFEFHRIAEEIRPSIVIVENIAHGKGAWLPTVRSQLCDLGYRTRAFALSAAEVGAPHMRRRVFVVAHADGVGVRDLAERMPPGRTRDLRAEGQAVAVDDRSQMAHSGVGRHEWPPLLGSPRWAEHRGPEPVVRRVPDGVPARVYGSIRRSRLHALGNAVVPQCAEVIGRIVLDLIANTTQPARNP